MKTIPFLVGCVSLSIAGCSTEVVSAPPPSASQACGETLCLDEDSQASLDETENALAMCVPSGEIDNGDPAGLRISEVSVTGVADGMVSLRVMLANTYPNDVTSYPGTRLRVVSGNAADPPEMTGQFYGIFGCDEEESNFTLAWDGQAPLTLVASAVNDLGESTIHEIELTLQPTP